MDSEENKGIEKIFDEQHVASLLKLDEDRERLTLLEQTWDSVTTRHLEALGISSGWVCLEVGSGHGSISKWLAERVQPDGKVVATDIVPELNQQSNDLLEIRRHNILEDPLEENHYDLVHCRALLQHLPRPDMALIKMLGAVKPGGWLCIEEFDNLAVPAADRQDPVSDSYYKNYHMWCELAIKTGAMIPDLGRYVRLVMDESGLEEVDCEGTTKIARGGDPWARFEALTNEAGLRTAERVLPPEQMESLKSFDTGSFNDPSFYFLSMPLFSAWGRKPK